ncbi:MAG TPA: DUF962 domain-containing protein [Gemmatales bacterium]|nr:DUF962 domain-containing protein [Gemmatales bacterium]
MASPDGGSERPRLLGREWWVHWLEPHQHPVNYALHLVGIPLIIIGPLLAPIFWWVGDSWMDMGWSVLLFLIGYGLQFLGHAIEGNDAGEIIAVKRWLGLPFVAVVPRVATGKESALHLGAVSTSVESGS